MAKKDEPVREPALIPVPPVDREQMLPPLEIRGNAEAYKLLGNLLTYCNSEVDGMDPAIRRAFKNRTKTLLLILSAGKVD